MNQRIAFLIVFLFFSVLGYGHGITTIKGYAPKYVGEEIKIYEYEDLLSMKEVLIATSIVKSDSSFSLSFQNSSIQKLVIRSKNNYSFVYAAPDETVQVYLPLHDEDKPYRPLGNYVTPIFLNLDSTNINFKIIKFNDEIDRFYALNMVKFVRNRQGFIDELKQFKDSVYSSIKDTNDFFRYFVHYSFADMDMNIYTTGKAQMYLFDTYIDKKKVLYHLEPYFKLIKNLYSQVFNQLELTVNNRVYMAIVKKSPKLIMQALEKDLMLGPSYIVKDNKIVKVYSNSELRELIMIKGLAEVYNSPDYPKTNVEEILDSIANYPMYPENGLIARNVLDRLTEATEGSPSPNFALTDRNGKLLTKSSLSGKYIYIHLFQPDYKTTLQDIELLEQIFARYNGMVNFVSIYTKNDKIDKRTAKAIQAIPWNVVELPSDDSFFKKFKVETYPFYILIDKTGTIVKLPALSPRANNEYETIDKVFFEIKKIEDKMNREQKDK